MKDVLNRKKWLWGLAGVISVLLTTLLVLTWTGKLRGTGAILPLSEVGDSWLNTGDPARDRVTQNQMLLDEIISYFNMGENRLPTTYQELADSIYMLVRPGDILNPYTNQPVQPVSQPSAGNFSWTYTSSELTVEWYPLIDGKIALGAFKKFSMGKGARQANQKYDLFPSYSQNEKALHFAMSLVDSYLFLYKELHKEYPATSAELIEKFPYAGKIRNPYTGEYALFVPPEQSSPGNFSYILLQNRTHFRLVGYGDNRKKIIFYSPEPGAIEIYTEEGVSKGVRGGKRKLAPAHRKA